MNSLFSLNGDKKIHINDVYDSIKGYNALIPHQMLNTIKSHPDVDYVEEDLQMHAYDVQYNAPWGLARTSSDRPLFINQNNIYYYDKNAGKDVNVYVLDTGVNINHSDFEGRAILGTSIPNGISTDMVGHGTHCAGIIGGKKYGIAKKVKIISVKVLADDGNGSYSDIIKGIEYVTSHVFSNGGKKGNVVNMSLGGQYSKAVNQAIEYAIKKGITFVVAAGNDSKNACLVSPASANGAITVGASTISDTPASFSNYGKCLDLYAPGQDIESTWIGSNYATNSISGTSMAAPHVAGMAAYIMSMSKNILSPNEVSNTLKSQSIVNSLFYLQLSSPNLLLHKAIF